MSARPRPLFVASLLLLSALWPLAHAADGPLVEVVQVEKFLVRDELITFGSLRSDESVMIRPEIEGRLASLHFREGQAVTAGTLLVSLDDAITRAELAQAQANLNLAEKNHQRAQMLFKRGASNAQALDEASAQQQAARASLALAQARLDKTRIHAPHSGVLGLRQVSPGDYLSAGQDIVNLEVLDPLKVDFRIPQKAVSQIRLQQSIEISLDAYPGDDLSAGQDIVNLEVLDPLKVDFRIPQKAVSQIRLQQSIEISLDAYPGERFSGEIYAINPRLDEAGRSQAIRARIENADGRLSPGQFVK